MGKQAQVDVYQSTIPLIHGTVLIFSILRLKKKTKTKSTRQQWLELFIEDVTTLCYGNKWIVAIAGEQNNVASDHVTRCQREWLLPSWLSRSPRVLWSDWSDDWLLFSVSGFSPPARCIYTLFKRFVIVEMSKLL